MKAGRSWSTGSSDLNAFFPFATISDLPAGDNRAARAQAPIIVQRRSSLFTNVYSLKTSQKSMARRD
jgi:hypothetical protein